MLHKSKKSLLGIVLFLCPFLTILAQIPVNGFYPEKNTFTIAPSYGYKSYDQFYRGSTLSEGNPAGLGEISSSIFSFYGQYAILDWLSTTVTLPYISVESEDGELDPIQNVDQVDGVQDLGIFLKARILEKKFDNSSKISLGGASGMTFPVGNYEGAGVLSLGNEATTVNGSAIFQYSTPIKIFSEIQLGYSLRNSDNFDIPNAMLYSAKIGYHNEFLYLHARLDIQDSMSGLDIGTPEFGAAGGAAVLPETEVDFTNLSFDFYVPVYKNSIGVSAGYGTTLDGRNYNKESAISFGLVYTAR
ncbi:hypothetical protein [Aquimarina algiphila]|uniref:Uncharacterized protein n=1 Tax=Aquimarina algiphila TaxID=2047982 RepID=A0A554VHN7_9FLAO|nr:hypothetical protein [Aquimarina algiphila]TSE07015.1 hypothetical protein FOF46_17490 [Aquimarina algiphila]